MCECCVAECKSISEILPNWWLVQASKDGYEMEKDDYGLVLCNGPSYIWAGKPPKDPHPNMDDDSPHSVSEDEFFEFLDSIEDCFLSDPYIGYKLWSATLEAGYDPEKDGYHMLAWLMNRIAETLENWNGIDMFEGKSHDAND